MIAGHYVWLTWSSAFLGPWLAFFIPIPRDRRTMAWASIGTMPFGLTEPLFVPRYWNPPSVWDLAQRAGFDVESLIFCFAIGGVGVVLYNAITKRDPEPLPAAERRRRRHRHHRAALFTPVAAFPALLMLGWNPIYPAILAMLAGAAATVACRRDLGPKTVVGGFLFAGYYAIFMLGLEWSSPGYIERVWNLGALSGVMIAGVPLEELLFGFAFGAYWSGVYEHLTWQRDVGVDEGRAPVAAVQR
jgi:hypothetical protein